MSKSNNNKKDVFDEYLSRGSEWIDRKLKLKNIFATMILLISGHAVSSFLNMSREEFLLDFYGNMGYFIFWFGILICLSFATVFLFKSELNAEDQNDAVQEKKRIRNPKTVSDKLKYEMSKLHKAKEEFMSELANQEEVAVAVNSIDTDPNNVKPQ
jgi:hypothetical protein